MKKEKVVGYGYVGRWSDGTLGWAMPNHVSNQTGKKRRTEGVPSRDWTRGETLEFCRITIEPILKNNGRKITRRAR